jgi:hypothetical protein
MLPPLTWPVSIHHLFQVKLTLSLQNPKTLKKETLFFLFVRKNKNNLSFLSPKSFFIQGAPIHMNQQLRRERRRCLSSFGILFLSALTGIINNLLVSSSDWREDFSLLRCPMHSAWSEPALWKPSVSKSFLSCLDCHFAWRYGKDLQGGRGIEFCFRDHFAASTITCSRCFNLGRVPT